VRFNAMQALLIDILLIVPNALESVFRGAPSGFGLTLYINAYNAIFWFVLVCFIYGVVSCVLGVTARLPLVSDAAEQQIY